MKKPTISQAQRDIKTIDKVLRTPSSIENGAGRVFNMLYYDEAYSPFIEAAKATQGLSWEGPFEDLILDVKKSVMLMLQSAVKLYLTSLGVEEPTEIQLERVLFEGYSVVDGNLVHNITGETIPNLAVTDLDLSVRANNVLQREGIAFIADFIGMNTATIMNFRNMGAGTLNELLTKLQALEDGDVSKAASEPVANEPIIAFQWQGKVVLDIPFDTFSLSVRSRNRMELFQIKSAKHFLALENVADISGLGQKSIEELATLKRQLLECAITGTEEKKQCVEELFKSAKAQLGYIYTADNACEIDSLILEKIFALPEGESSLQKLMELVQSDKAFYNLFEPKVVALIRESLFDGITPEDIANIVGLDSELAAKIITEIISKGVAYKEDSKLYFVFPSIMEAINVLSDQEIQVITRRLNGENLEEIGKSLDFTRERIRQIVEKGYEKIFVKNKRAETIDYVKEDKYKYFFETYYMSQEDFCEIASEAEYVWNYLDGRYYNGEGELNSALSDEKLTRHLRYGIQKFLNKGVLIIGNLRVPINKIALRDYVLSTYCLNDTNFDDFVKLYNDFLEERNLTANEKLQLDVSRVLENALSRSRKVLWKPNRRLRYYNMDEIDFFELLQTINLKRYRNIEFSAEKFFKEYSELMKAYDIRDRYELHNLLRKIYVDDGYVDFSRNPTIRFGEFNRDKAVIDAIYLLSPISPDELAKFLSEEYGFTPDIIKANWLSSANLYYNNGIYSVKNEELPKEDYVALKTALTEDFYFIDEVKDVYRSISKNYDETLLSSYNFKRLGFTPYCDYVVRSTMSADAYFRKALTTEDIFDATEICNRFTGISIFHSRLADLRASHEIIEYEPYKYVNIRKLNEQGITKTDIVKFCNEVYNNVQEGEYFTFKLLFDCGVVQKLSNLEYGELFYASLLRGDSRFTYRKMNGNVVFIKGDKKFTRKDFFEYIFKDKDSMMVGEFQKYLSDIYGLTVPRDDIYATVSNSNLSYDPITGTISRQ